MEKHRPSTVAELLWEAGKALAERDPDRLNELLEISDTWMQSENEAAGQRVTLAAMAEAAELLDDTPSFLSFD